jgi:endo-1,4-beta-D-glucanase Y
VVLTDINTGVVEEVLSDPGYGIIPALALCVARDAPVPDALRSFQTTLYYPSTLHLLGLALLSSSPGGCRYTLKEPLLPLLLSEVPAEKQGRFVFGPSAIRTQSN